MHRFLAGLSLLGSLAVGHPMSAFGDQGRREIREEFLSLSASIDIRTPAYSRSEADEGFVAFDSGTIVLQISLSNFTNRPVTFSLNRKDWSEGISIDVKRQGDADVQLAERRGARLRRASNQLNRGIARLDARRSLSDRFVLDTDNVLEPGEYRIVVQFSDDELDETARQSRNILKREIKLRVVDPQSSLEKMDQLLQLASQAMKSGQFAVVRKLAAQVLALNTESIAARADIGQSYLAQKNCADAKPVLTEAIELLEAGRDSDLKLSESVREELRWGLRDQLAKACP